MIQYVSNEFLKLKSYYCSEFFKSIFKLFFREIVFLGIEIEVYNQLEGKGNVESFLVLVW